MVSTRAEFRDPRVPHDCGPNVTGNFIRIIVGRTRAEDPNDDDDDDDNDNGGGHEKDIDNGGQQSNKREGADTGLRNEEHSNRSQLDLDLGKSEKLDQTQEGGLSNELGQTSNDTDVDAADDSEALIDNEGVEFCVHENLICTRSAFFRKAMNGTWKESEEKYVELPEDEPDIFRLYVELLYSARLTTKTLAYEVISLCKLYVLAEKLQDSLSKNLIIDALVATTRELGSDGKHSYPGE
ncbi:hypothetical protein BDV95DRAFT_577969 [Massariosphaeria phaeospora]|uniref:BTB domain-containing protein n=1 Tax=Massariosphaeria phaeospora TaxID=100035 RepID=A0A7C8M579_9PLEO|nr:hypothetical protein BDV95DRAFT_577969 [Massariosphaeria phaeospora]